MRIVQANKYYYPRGGAETYLLALSDWLTREGHGVIPFAMRHPENLPTPYEKYFVSQVITDPSERPSVFQQAHTFGRMMYSLAARRNMATLLYEHKPDLCHIHNLYTQISPSVLHTLADRRVPVVMTVHDHHLISPQYGLWAQGCGNNYTGRSIVRGTFARFHKGSLAASFAQVSAYTLHRAMRVYEKHVRLFLCPSLYLKRRLIAGGFPAEHVRVLPYGIDASKVEPSYTHDGSFLFVGRLSEEKGAATVVRIAKLLPDIVFNIVGRGPQMDSLHRLAIDVPNVHLLGFRTGDELASLYRSACAVLLPSRMHEVFPLVALEAMGYGKPVIASDVGGVGEAVEDRVSGMLVAPTDLNGWVEAVVRIAYDDTFQQFLARSARARVERKFRLDDHHRLLMGVYREVLDS